MLKVIVADDHHLVREGIRALLEKNGNVQVLGEASNGIEAVKMVETLSPDLIVMDISMPKLDGIQATEQISKLNVPTRVIILSMHSKASIVQEVLRKGAKGYLLKSAISEELSLAIQAASHDNIYLSPSVSLSLLDNLWALQAETGQTHHDDLLTARERQVLQLIAEGYTNNEIAAMLTVSVKTVEKHRTNLMSKLNVHDVPSLIRTAIKYNLIFID
ncbi:MAG: response regulator transcription factor [Ardenticatenaceae bacterium]|nr:response regulator transcription factor [Ardenticatenaceae bacterium]